jgi:hypothetical protein
MLGPPSFMQSFLITLVSDGHANFGLIDTNRAYEFSSKELDVIEGER